MNRLSVFALAFAAANASLLHKRQGFSSDSPSDFADYISNVCMALDETVKSDMNLPCNQLISIQYQCIGGSKLGDSWRDRSSDDEDVEDDDDDEEEQMLPNEAQRVCICQSQHNDLMKGCAECHRVHGGVAPEKSLTDSQIHAVMDKYCDASTPANDSYANTIYKLAYMGPDWDDISSPDSDSTTYSDPIGSATDVSLYFTASVTGSAAYIPGLPTGSVSDMTYTSSSTSDGLIVPTALGSEKEGTSSGEAESTSVSAGVSASASSSGGSETVASDGGAMQTAMAHPGALGALGLAAMIAAF
jgi:hypothetical protein